jgi:hypothetical protein
MKDEIRFLVVSVAIVGLLIGAVWGFDVWKDRKHSIHVLARTPLYGGEESCFLGAEIGTIQPGAAMKIKRISYPKDCAIIDVSLGDGRSGYIVLDSSVSVSPPLP